MRTLLRSKSMLPLLIISFLCVALVYRMPWFRIQGLHSYALISSLVLKCMVGFALLWLYGQVIDIERADADVFRYFDDASVMHSSASESLRKFWRLFSGARGEELSVYFEAMHNWDSPRGFIHSNDNRTMIRLHSVIMFFSNGDIRVHQVLFAFLSLVGLVALFKGFDHWSRLSPWTFWIICILPPSLLFWASGMLKETIVMLPLGLFIYGISKLGTSKKAIFSLMIGVIGFCLMKPYIGLCLLPGVFFLILDKYLHLSSRLTALLTLLVSILLVFLSSMTDGFDLIGILAREQQAFIKLAQAESAGSFVVIPQFTDFISFLLQSPGAVVRSLFRPWLWEMRGPFDALAAFENILYILLILAAIVYRKKQIDMRPIYFALFFVMSLSILVGSVTPVLGAVVRYKAPMLPFLVYTLLLMIDFNRIPFARIRVDR